MLVEKASGDLDYKAYELKKCGKIKTILMVAVVLYHSMLCSAGVTWGPWTAYQTSKTLHYIAYYLNSVHIYAFTFVSGYVYAFLRYETDRYSDWKKVIEKKVRRLLLPYASAAIFWAIPFCCFFWKTNLKELTVKFLLGASPNQLWFLLAICPFPDTVKENYDGKKEHCVLLAAVLVLLLFWNGSFYVKCPEFLSAENRLNILLILLPGHRFPKNRHKAICNLESLFWGDVTKHTVVYMRTNSTHPRILSKSNCSSVESFRQYIWNIQRCNWLPLDE